MMENRETEYPPQSEEQRQGHLKIFFGYAARSGKDVYYVGGSS